MPVNDFKPLDDDDLKLLAKWLAEEQSDRVIAPREMLHRLIRQSEVAYDLSVNGARCAHGHNAPMALWNCPVCTDPMIMIVREKLGPLFAVINKYYPNPTRADMLAVQTARAQVLDVARQLFDALPRPPAGGVEQSAAGVKQ